MGKVHYAEESEAIYSTLCGRLIDYMKLSGLETTDIVNEVDCKHCIRLLRKEKVINTESSDKES